MRAQTDGARRRRQGRTLDERQRIALLVVRNDAGPWVHVLGCERGRKPVFLYRLPWKIAITFDELMRKLIAVFHDREDVEHMRARMTA